MPVASSGRSPALRAAPNVLPMIDIMLVLLIIFMIVTPLVQSEYVIVPNGDHLEAAPERGEPEVVLRIDRAGWYALNGAPVSASDLEPELRTRFRARTGDAVLFLKADRSLPFGIIAEGVEHARRAGVRVIAAVGEPRLLIMFILAQPLARQVLDWQVPPPALPSRTPAWPPIVLAVTGVNEYTINGLAVPGDQLTAQLRAMFDPRPAKVLLVTSTPERTYQDVIAAMDLARGAGVQVIGWLPGDITR